MDLFRSCDGTEKCGFASTHHGNKVTEDIERRKLRRIIEVADEVWGAPSRGTSVLKKRYRRRPRLVV
jgi:hypothetical protein